MIRAGSGLQYISILALIQIVFVIISFFAVGIVMKIHGYPETPRGCEWNTVPLLMRTKGGLLLLVPLLWTGLAIWLESKNEDESRGWLGLVAFGFIVILLFLTLSALVDPYTRKFMFLYG